MLPALLVQGVPMPQPGQDAWPWAAFVLAVAVGTLFWRLMARVDAEIARIDKDSDDWRDQAKTATAELGKNNDLMRDMTNVIEKQRVAVETLTVDHKRLADRIDDLGRRIDGLDRRPAGRGQ